MGRVFTLIELSIDGLLSTRTIVAGYPNGEFLPCGAAFGAPFPSPLSSLTSSASCGAGVGAGVVGPGVVFGECTTWTLSCWTSSVDPLSGNTGT